MDEDSIIRNDVQNKLNMPDEPASLLNTAQRAYLRGEENPDGQRERRIRMDIRNRVIQGLHDFVLLNEQLADDDREQLFAKAFGDPLTGQPPLSIDRGEISLKFGAEFEGGSPHAVDGLVALLCFLYRGLRDYGFTDGHFEGLIERALRKGASLDINGKSQSAIVDVDIHITRQWDPEQLYNRWISGEGLSHEEYVRLVAWEGFGADDLERLQRDLQAKTGEDIN